MTPNLKQFGLDELSVADRLALADALWDSVYEDFEQEPLPKELVTELERRAALADAEPSRGASWEAVRAAAKARWAE